MITGKDYLPAGQFPGNVRLERMLRHNQHIRFQSQHADRVQDEQPQRTRSYYEHPIFLLRRMLQNRPQGPGKFRN
jgi:hypothetical protein